VANVALAPGEAASFSLLFSFSFFLSSQVRGAEVRATETGADRARNVADNVSGAVIRAGDPIRFIAAANRRRPRRLPAARGGAAGADGPT